MPGTLGKSIKSVKSVKSSDVRKIGLGYDKKGQVIKPDPQMTPRKFKLQADYFTEKNEIEHVKQLRIGTWLETKKVIDTKSLSIPSKTSTLHCTAKNTHVPIQGFSGKVAPRNEVKSVRNPKMWSLPKVDTKDLKCEVEVVEQDTLACAAMLQEELKVHGISKGVVAVLNMACFKHAGGGLLHGAGAQEENLCRRTNLISHLQSAKYPLSIAECHVSRGVYYLRGTESDGYPMLKRSEQKRFCFISAAAYNCPPLIHDDGRPRLRIEHAAGLYLTMCAIIRGAQSAGATRLVLSALGCGAYGTPPTDVARLFAHAIKNEGFHGKVVFAILPDHRHGDENVKVFRREFH